ncbi:aldehyde:ferredoxin oxidoreductase, partial [Archaeoglobales archaeon]
NCGGFFGPYLKFAGYDALIVKGKSKKPVYILIDETVEIKDASHLWGKDTFETEDTIKADEGKVQVLSIGPAGENLVRFACITHNKGRQFGRSGAGAVMGSKNLKAIAVRGDKRVEVADPDALEKFRNELNEKIKERLAALSEYGTPQMAGLINSSGSLPTRYWTEGYFDRLENISAETMKKRIYKRKKACFACSVACGKVSKVEEGFYSGTEVEGPEYETLYAFGPLCDNDNLESIVKANEVCDKLGMDTISAGNILAFVMECSEKGILDKVLEFGDHSGMIHLLYKVAYRKDIGNTLAEGVKKAASVIGKGTERIAVHVKGLEPPGFDPRGLKGVALAYAVSPRGACHVRHLAHRPNVTGTHPFDSKKKIDRLSYDDQPELIKKLEDFYTIVDSMILCKFITLPTVGPILWDDMANLYQIVTGIPTDVKKLIFISERINDLVRLINIREGVVRADDTLPYRFMNTPLKNGASRGEIVEKRKFERMLDRYYELRGWG